MKGKTYMPARNKFLDDKIDEISRMYNEENYTLDKLAIYFNVHKGTIKRRLREHNISKKDKVSKDMLIELYLKKGYTQLEIAKYFNKSQASISNRLKKWNISNFGSARFSKVVIPKDIVMKMYEKENYTQGKIAAHFGTSIDIIRRRLIKWGINNSDTNRFNRKNIPKNVLNNMYWNKKMSMSEIAKVFKCDDGTISKWMVRYNIPKRSASECIVYPSIGRYKGAHYDTPNQGRKWMRSGWELKTADYLTSIGINWYYEYKWLKLGKNIHYLPDFFIPAENKYIEVKGWKTEKTMKKYKLAKKKYNIELWDRDELLKRNIIGRSGI